MSSSTSGILVGVFAVVIIGLIAGFYIRRREITFEGEVIDKNIAEHQTQNTMPMNRPGIMIGGSTGGVTHSYTIKVKTDAGKQINYQISSGLYEIIKIGDRVSKPKGTTEVSIVQSNPSATPPASGTNPPAPPVSTPTPPIGPQIPTNPTNPQSLV